MLNLYPLVRPALFSLDAETAHHLTLNALVRLQRLGLPLSALPAASVAPIRVMGLDFPTPVGLAAGLDKNGEYIDALGALGFGFLEIGTVTPRPQPGNARPRLFRLPRAQALINRMGFNNHGVDALIAHVKAARYDGVLGINIGKNFDTPIEQATEDYLIGLRKVYPYATYVTVNISSPNTANLRDLQQDTQLNQLLARLKEEQHTLQRAHQRYVPLVVKIAPDMTEEAIAAVAECLLAHEVDGVIATNTTVSRDGVTGLRFGDEAGGLSGAPLTGRATEVVAQLYACVGDRIAIIASGGVMSLADAQTKLAAGASLVQVYSGLIYRGPALIRELTEGLSQSSD